MLDGTGDAGGVGPGRPITVLIKKKSNFGRPTKPLCYLDFVEKFEHNIYGQTHNPEEELVEEMELYISAHRLIPKAFIFNGSAASSLMVDKATNDLFRNDIHYLVRLSAIVTLGHSPCKRAVDALQSFIDTNHPLSQVAALALSECLTLFTMPHRGVIPEKFHIG